MTTCVTYSLDYYSFGSVIPGRNFTPSNGYRYGFNGQEKEDEVAGEGNSYTAEYWQYDSRLGRRWNIDPVTVPYESPYGAFRNNPIMLSDPNGDCADCPKPEKKGTAEAEKQTTTAQKDINMGVDGGIQTVTVEKNWYWHGGSKVTTCDENGKDKVTGYDAGWYGASEYKKILSGTSMQTVSYIPLNQRLFVRDALGLTGKKYTEKDLSVDELISLSKIVRNALNRSSNLIEYKDYKTTSNGNQYSDVGGGQSASDAWKSMNNTAYSLKTTFGQATVTVMNGKVIVTDQFNFNDKLGKTQGMTKLEVFNAWLSGAANAGAHPYTQARNYSSYYGSGEGEGTVFEIELPSILMK